MFKTAIIAAALALTATTAFAEIQYSTGNDDRRADVMCVAALSIARDGTADNNIEAYQFFTSVQNQFILKYDRIPTKHIDARKLLINTRASSNPAYVQEVIADCING